MVDILLAVKTCFVMLKYQGYAALYLVSLYRITCKKIRPFLHLVKATAYQILKSGSRKILFKCSRFTKVVQGLTIPTMPTDNSLHRYSCYSGL